MANRKAGALLALSLLPLLAGCVHLTASGERTDTGQILRRLFPKGELGRALRNDDPDNLREEFADVFAWMATLASIAGVELTEAVDKYAAGCPRCHAAPCTCSNKR